MVSETRQLWYANVQLWHKNVDLWQKQQETRIILAKTHLNKCTN